MTHTTLKAHKVDASRLSVIPSSMSSMHSIRELDDSIFASIGKPVEIDNGKIAAFFATRTPMLVVTSLRLMLVYGGYI